MRPVVPARTTAEANPRLGAICPAGVLPVGCPTCRMSLAIHMPREANPEQLIGICPLCEASFAFAWSADGTEVWIGPLPGEPRDPWPARRIALRREYGGHETEWRRLQEEPARRILLRP